jgi:two-component system OmpR family sensor kinase
VPRFGPNSLSWYYALDGSETAGPANTLIAPGDVPDLGAFSALVTHADDRPFTVAGPTSSWRVQMVTREDGLGYVVVAVSLREVDATQNRLLIIDIAVTALVLVLIGIAAASVVRIGLRPLTRMEQIAAEIASGNLSRRVRDADPHTESGRLGTALNAMLVQIETAMAERTASEQRLRQFLADASHELRTPLTSIQGFAELYRRGGAPPGPELDEAMGRIEAEVGRMRLLVNDLLLLSRLDEERAQECRPVDLLAVAADTVRDAHVRVPTRFVMLGPLDDNDDTFDPVTVHGDESRLRQVVTNLVVNALQHTPDDAEVMVRVGRIWIGPDPDPAGPTAVTGHRLPDGATAAVIEVTDTGPGMEPAVAARVFERLYRADASRSRRQGGGSGLGLSIVAAIVATHGGRVELRTTPGGGARFRVLLPTEPPPTEPVEAGAAEAGATELASGRQR